MSNILQIIVAALLGVLSLFQPHKSPRQKPAGQPQPPASVEPGNASSSRGNPGCGDAGPL